MLDSWWRQYDEPGPLPTMVPAESTWVLELDNRPALAVSLIYTNISEYCYVENFIGNPELKGVQRKVGGHHLLKYISEVARARGYRRLLCLGYKNAVKRRYLELGFKSTLDNLSSFVKEV